MKLRNILYIILMVVFISFAYLLFDRGINAKTKIVVNYQEKSDLLYKVYLKDNDIYSKKYLTMDKRYISKLVDNILVEFNYNSLFDKDINGYYSYTVLGNLIAYENDATDKLFEKEYTLLDIKAKPLDANNVREINIDDEVIVDFNKYKDELEEFKKNYNIDVSGYLEVIVKINETLEFSGIDKVNETVKEMKLTIPLSYDTFKINAENENNKIDSYYDFSRKERMNYLLIFIGIFSLSIGLSFLGLTIRNMIIASRKGLSYNKKLTKILNEYSDIIVNVKRFYNKKKYNLIYVDSFDELLSVQQKLGNPISFRETKKGEEAVFLMTEDENAWIYQMKNKK